MREMLLSLSVHAGLERWLLGKCAIPHDGVMDSPEYKIYEQEVEYKVPATGGCSRA
jgi:hypothetical protein